MSIDPNRAASRALEVVVPASTSNLGSGFDFLGLALSLFLRVRATPDVALRESELSSLEGTAAEWPRAGENLLVRAFERTCERLRVRDSKLRLSARSEIPIARGLGSSGAAVVAGMLLANALAEEPASTDELLAWGLESEGHPDNSSAALIGGCTLSVPLASGAVKVVRQELHPDLGFALAWPARGLATSTARRALPRSVPLADAVENPRRLALLLEGLRRADPELLELGGEDRLHVAHRLPLIPGGERALAAARAAGAWLATISGSGSGMIAIGPKARVEQIGRAMAAALCTDAGDAEHRAVAPVFGAPVVREVPLASRA
jgi:homoserine kinase